MDNYVEVIISYLIKIVIVSMRELYELLYKIYIKELNHVVIGYPIDQTRLRLMFDIMNAIEYIRHGKPLTSEISKIIQYYE